MLVQLLNNAYTADVLNQGTLSAALDALREYAAGHGGEVSEYRSKLTDPVTERCFVSKKHKAYLDQLNA